MKFWPISPTHRLYADAAAATPISRAVMREIKRLLPLFGNSGALHREGTLAKKELERARERAAKAIGAHTDEIVFTSGGTEGNNLAIFGALRPLMRNKRKKVHAITTAIEHPSVLEPLHALAREGLMLTVLPVDSEGRVDVKVLHEALTKDTVFISVQIVNSEVGTVQDIREIAKEIRHAKRSRGPQSEGRVRSSGPERPSVKGTIKPIYFHCDASQAPLWFSLQVEKLGVDLMTLDAQKMMGPKGAGLLYIRRGTALEPLLWGGGQEKGLRSGTENVVAAGATATALEEAQKKAAKRAAHTAAVRDYLLVKTKELISGIILNGAVGEGRIANNLNISIPDLDGQMAVVALDVEGVAASTRSACSAEDEVLSYILLALGRTELEAASAVRLTLLPDAKKSDARRIARALHNVAQRYRNVIN